MMLVPRRMPVCISGASALCVSVHQPHKRAAGSVSSNRHKRAVSSRAPRHANIPIRSAHTHACYHSHEAPSMAAPLAQLQGWRVAPPTHPPSLQPHALTAGRGSGGGHGAPAYSALASPSALCELSPAEKAVKYYPPSMGRPKSWGQLNKASWACALAGSHLAFCEVRARLEQRFQET